MSDLLAKFLSLVIILLVFWGVKESITYWKSFKASHPDGAGSAAANAARTGPASEEESLPGLPPSLEPFLQAAKKQGAKTFKKWLDYYRPQISDPRLAWIELDYVVMVSAEDMPEARRVFAEVKARTPKTSPVYSRVKQLESAYE